MLSRLHQSLAPRFLADRLEGLRARYRGQPPTVLTAKMETRIPEQTRQAPPDGSKHWNTRKLGRVLKIHHNLVAKAFATIERDLLARGVFT